MPSNDTSPKNKDARNGGNVTLVIILLCLMVIGMVWSLNYTFPSGKSLDFWGFVGLWFRELVIVGFAVIILLIFAWTRLSRLLRKSSTKEQDAL